MMTAELQNPAAAITATPWIHAATTVDFAAASAFLSSAGLPTADLAASAPYLWIARASTDVAGIVGLEVYGTAGLLRSLAVAVGSRRDGLGTRLVDRAEQEARGLGLAELVLLTETAAEFFAGLGYRVVARESVPAAIRSSEQFRALCPDSAICMRKAFA